MLLATRLRARSGLAAACPVPCRTAVRVLLFVCMLTASTGAGWRLQPRSDTPTARLPDQEASFRRRLQQQILEESTVALLEQGSILPSEGSSDQGCLMLSNIFAPGTQLISAQNNTLPSTADCCQACWALASCNAFYYCSNKSGCLQDQQQYAAPYQGCGLLNQPLSAPETGWPIVGFASAAITSGAPIRVKAEPLPGYQALPGLGFYQRYDYACSEQVVESPKSKVCGMLGTPQELAAICNADPSCLGMSYFPRGRDYLGSPAVLFKGGPGVSQLDLSLANYNQNAVLYVKQLPGGGSSGGSGSSSLSGGAIAGIVVAACVALAAAAGALVVVRRRRRLAAMAQAKASGGELSNGSCEDSDQGGTQELNGAGTPTTPKEAGDGQPSLAPIATGNPFSLVGAACSNPTSLVGANSVNPASLAGGTSGNLPSLVSINSGNAPSLVGVNSANPPSLVSINSGNAPSLVGLNSANPPSLVSINSGNPPSLVGVNSANPPSLASTSSANPPSPAQQLQYSCATIWRAGSAAVPLSPFVQGTAVVPPSPFLTTAPASPFLPASRKASLESGKFLQAQQAAATSRECSWPGALGVQEPQDSSAGAPASGTTQAQDTSTAGTESKGQAEEQPMEIDTEPPTASALFVSLADENWRSWLVDPSRVEFCRDANGAMVKLGAGASGKVYKVMLDKVQPFAGKVVELGMDSRTQKSFVQEAFMLQQLRHPNIIGFGGVCIINGRGILLMELMEGGDLFSRLSARFRTSGERTFAWNNRGKRVALDCALAIHHLHTNNLTHFDIKSPNVLLTRTLAAKIADVGFTKMTLNSHHSMSSMLTGTFAYMAPEQLSGEKCTQKVDIFSFGILLWEICTGEHPVRGGNRPLVAPQDCPQEVVDLYLECTAQEPSARPSAKEVVQRLAKMCAA